MSIDPISAALDLGTELVKRIFPDPEEQAKELFKLNELAQSGDIEKLKANVSLLQGQMKINEIEAKSGNIFVAGWRPFVGWVCGIALLYSALLEPFMRFVATTIFSYVGTFPVIDTSLTMQVLLGMLGLAGMRTHEKKSGVANGTKKG